MRRYEVTFDPAYEPDIVTAFSPDDAVDSWCKGAEQNGVFTDGWPDGLRVSVKGPDGNVSNFTVTTEWEPSFYICEAEA